MIINFLSVEMVLNLHEKVVERFGGRQGIIQGRSIESLLNRIHNHIEYGVLEKNSLPAIAAKYALAISQGHVFIDGNKRTAFASMETFLEANNFYCDFKKEEILEKLENLAAKRINEGDVEEWITHSLENR